MFVLLKIKLIKLCRPYWQESYFHLLIHKTKNNIIIIRTALVSSVFQTFLCSSKTVQTTDYTCSYWICTVRNTVSRIFKTFFSHRMRTLKVVIMDLGILYTITSIPCAYLYDVFIWNRSVKESGTGESLYSRYIFLHFFSVSYVVGILIFVEYS